VSTAGHGWVDQCATRIMNTIANLDAVKAHVAHHRPDWREPGELTVGNLEFVGRIVDPLRSITYRVRTQTVCCR
jgi:hypothetical protein